MTQQAIAMIDHDQLPAVESAPLPAVYEAARLALSQCCQIDECKDWADKAEALASYARQAKDDTLLKHAMKIQSRAIERCGELMKILPINHDRRSDQRESSLPLISRTEAAEQAGLSEWQRKTALRVASIPKDILDALIESDNPPTITELAELGKQSKPKPLIDLAGIDPEAFKLATQCGGMIKDLATFCSQHDPVMIRNGFKAQEQPAIMRLAETIVVWLDYFCKE